jgi:hypothetical protein
MMMLTSLGINITPLIAGASVVGLAISFGSQARDQATRLATQVPTMVGMSGARRSREACHERSRHLRF